MQLNKYLQYIVRREAQSETDTIDLCLAKIQAHKREKLRCYLLLIQKRLRLTSRPPG